jgi:hypothetical protein
MNPPIKRASAMEDSGSSRRKKKPNTRLVKASFANEILFNRLNKSSVRMGRKATIGRILKRFTKERVTPLKL